MTNDGDIIQRVIVKKIIAEDPKKFEVVHIMSNGGDPTQWVTVNSDMGTRVGGEYETTTQSSQDIDAFTEHSKPRAMRKSWDTEPPPADIDASDKSWDTGQPPADIDAAQDAGTTPKPRARRNHWDAGPPPADIDAYDKSWDSRQPPADIDAAQDAGTNTYTHPQETGGPHTPHTHTSHTHTRRTLGKRQRSPYTR